MSKMNEARILNALNESRKNPKRFNLRESYFTEDDDFDDVVETDDYDPDYDDDDDINVYQTTVVDVLSDVEGAIDDMDAIEDDLFAVEDELEDDNDEWYDDEDEWEDDEYYDDDEYDDDEWYDDEDDIIDIEVPDDVDDIDIPEAMLREKFKTVQGKRRKISSSQARNSKKKKKGYVVDSKTGRRRKQTAAEKAAHKKRGNALKHLSSSKRKKAARKAAKTRKMNNEAWSTNEKAFAMLMNGVLSNASRKSHGRLQKVKITKVNEGYVRGNRITLNCNVKNARGQRDRAKFIINGRPNGSYTINEASDFFRNSGLHVGGRYHVNRGRFVFDSMGYNLKSRGGRSVNESFKVVNN